MDIDSILAPREQQCGAKPLEWVLFILSIISTHVTWWLLPLPTLYKYGFKHYVHDVSWECLRLHLPSFAAAVACFGHERVHWQSNYYSGSSKPSTTFDTTKVLAKDILIVVTTCLAVYHLCSGDQNQDLSGLNITLWTYPSLPVAIFGLSISIFSRTPPVVKTWHIALATLTIIIVIATAIALTIEYTVGNNLWVLCTIFMIFMATPVWKIHYKVISMGLAIAAYGRAGGPLTGALSPGAYFPFCELRGWGLAGPLLAFTIMSGALAWVAAVSTMKPREAEPGVEMEEIP